MAGTMKGIKVQGKISVTKECLMNEADKFIYTLDVFIQGQKSPIYSVGIMDTS